MSEIDMKTEIVHTMPKGMDCAPAINQMLEQLPDNTRLAFEAGEYLLASRLLVKDKNNVILDGQNATIIIHNDPEQDYRHSTDGFHVENCRQLTIRNFHLTNEHLAAPGGDIIAVEEHSVIIKFRTEPPLTGRERFVHAMAFDKTGRPLGIFWCTTYAKDLYSSIGEEIVTSAPELVDTPHEKLGENTFRVPFFEAARYARVGMTCNMKHTGSGLSSFIFRDSTDVLVENVWISNFGGMAVVILPRCANFTFRNFCCKVEDSRLSPYSCTLDAIHTTGLGGQFVMEDCYFNGVGDDILNSHTPALRIHSSHDNRLELYFDKPHALFPKRWGRSGDLLRLHDGASLEYLGDLRVDDIQENIVRWVPANEGRLTRPPRPGDYVVNAFYNPEITIRNCVALNSRSRICLQAASRAEIYGNHFDMVSYLAPVYISAAFNYWGEAGYVQNVDIHDNIFYCIPAPQEPDHAGHREAIWVRVNEKVEGAPDCIRNRHHNISIHHNTIFGNVVASNVDNLSIHHNRFDTSPEQAIQLHQSCINTDIRDNIKL